MSTTQTELRSRASSPCDPTHAVSQALARPLAKSNDSFYNVVLAPTGFLCVNGGTSGEDHHAWVMSPGFRRGSSSVEAHQERNSGLFPRRTVFLTSCWEYVCNDQFG